MRYDDALALRDAAARPVLEQIREDLKQIPKPARRILERLEHEIFLPGLKVAELLRDAKARGTRSLERFQAVTTLSPSVYILEGRLETALRLLAATELTVEAIAGLVGFLSADSFRRAFYRHFRLAPSQYRENARVARARGVAMPEPALLRHRHVVLAAKARAASKDAGAMPAEEPRARGLAALAPGECLRVENVEAEIAQVWWERLRGLPMAEQRRELQGGYRFETPAMFHHLRQRSAEEGRSDRRRGVELAQLALERLTTVGSALASGERSLLLARAWLTLGNAHRLLLEHAEAEEAFANAAVLLKGLDAPPGLRAELAWEQCDLRRYQRRFSDALAFAEEAVVLSQGDSSTLAKALLRRGGVWWHLGEWQRAAADYRAAARGLEGCAEPYLELVAVQNLAAALFYWERYEKAGVALERAKELAERLGEAGPTCHIRWLEGLLASRSKRAAAAKAHLVAAREGLRTLGEWGHVAVVSLDLATVLLAEGRAEEAVEILGEALPHLAALGFEGEGLVGLKLLQQAVVERQVGLGLVERVRASARALPDAHPPMKDTARDEGR